MEQRELVERLLRRDETGMEELLRHYGPLMKYVIAPILPDTRDREDCLSEAALRVWERIGQFDGERGSWAAWLTALTRNTALNRARSNARHGGEALSEQTPSQEPGPEETVLQRERRGAVYFTAPLFVWVFEKARNQPRKGRFFKKEVQGNLTSEIY